MDNFDKNKPILLQNDVFEEAASEFNQSATAKRLQNKYEVKPYYKRFKPLRIAVLGASYVFNFVSGVAASSLVFYFMKSISSGFFGDFPSILIATTVTLCSIGLLEYVKRIVNGTIIKDGFQFKKFRFGFAAMALLISGISITSSFYGGKRTIVELTPPPELVSKDSMTNDLENQIADIKIDKANLAKNTVINKNGKEVIYFPSQQSITILEQKEMLITSRLIRVQESQENENGVIKLEYESTTKLSAWSFAWITVACEILFFICLFYLEFYDYRSITEFAQMGVAEEIQNVEVVPVSHSVSGVSETGVSETPVPVSVSGKERFSLETGMIPQILETMQRVIEGENDQTKRLELKSYRKSVQQYFWKLETETGKPETAKKNIVIRVEDFEKASGRSLT